MWQSQQIRDPKFVSGSPTVLRKSIYDVKPLQKLPPCACRVASGAMPGGQIRRLLDGAKEKLARKGGLRVQGFSTACEFRHI